MVWLDLGFFALLIINVFYARGMGRGQASSFSDLLENLCIIICEP